MSKTEQASGLSPEQLFTSILELRCVLVGESGETRLSQELAVFKSTEDKATELGAGLRPRYPVTRLKFARELLYPIGRELSRRGLATQVKELPGADVGGRGPALAMLARAAEAAQWPLEFDRDTKLLRLIQRACNNSFAPAALRWIAGEILLLAAEQEPSGSSATPPPKAPDGPEGDRWVRWRGVRHGIPTGTIHRLITFMWNRDSAKYAELFEVEVFDADVAPGSVVRRCSEASSRLLKIGVPWRLSANSNDGVVTKVDRSESGQNP